ncbi:MAG: DNA-binding protein [Kordiimonadaceae bacterium]|nr:DNA-binding protein [Kordiimonadaceae bacterium]PCJ37816.1 MAG: DNA-binding protein [Cellvibrionales bacterium]
MNKSSPNTPLPYPQTPESARAWFVDHGICQTAWSKSLGISRAAVVDLIHGRRKGHRGEGHRAAILLGLKLDPSASQAA